MASSTPNIVDIRRSVTDDFILKEMKSMLRMEPKQMPTLLLYDAKGLKLFEDITYLDEYYLTNTELEILKRDAVQIAQQIPEGTMVVELGSGNLRKVSILLKALEDAGKSIDYYALDLSYPELERTLAEACAVEFKHVRCHGLYGTYDDGLAWIQEPENVARHKCILSLGSSIGNFNFSEAGQFLRMWSDALSLGDNMLIALDACEDPKRVYHAYNDRKGVTHDFIYNGLHHANTLLGEETFQIKDWDVVGRVNEIEKCHEAFYCAKADLEVCGCKVEKGEMVKVEQSHKFNESRAAQLWEDARLLERARFESEDQLYHLHLLSPAMALQSSDPSEYAASPVPTLDEWNRLWTVWDQVTLQMVPKEKLGTKPIDLRNPIIFYLGHIPTFLDIHLTRATGEDATEPKEYGLIFERGIDPDVDDPTHCHSHSQIPKTWPDLKDILSFADRVRDRLRDIYATERHANDPKVGRATWLAFEHEAMHLETLLYMLVQTDINPPQGSAIPDFLKSSVGVSASEDEDEWHQIPPTTISIGTDDPESVEGSSRYFGWDNEKPLREANVSGFSARGKMITNLEYVRYLLETAKTSEIPATWRKENKTKDANDIASSKATNGILNGQRENSQQTNGTSKPQNLSDILSDQEASFISQLTIRTVYGSIPLKVALDWPAVASYDELSGCAHWLGGRIPTADEVRSIYNYVDILKRREASKVLSKKISAVNGHLSNDGVEETPPSSVSSEDGAQAPSKLDPENYFVDLSSCNVGFRHWHQTTMTGVRDRPCGRGETGGAWEWTSTVLEKHEGFEAMESYPGYTADFFDDKHNIVLGGSWASHPRIAGRKSFVNWYQRAYRYAWAGARLVKDN